MGMVILFTTSNWSGRTVLALKKILRDKGIIVTDDYFKRAYAEYRKQSGSSRAVWKEEGLTVNKMIYIPVIRRE